MDGGNVSWIIGEPLRASHRIASHRNMVGGRVSHSFFSSGRCSAYLIAHLPYWMVSSTVRSMQTSRWPTINIKHGSFLLWLLLNNSFGHIIDRWQEWQSESSFHTPLSLMFVYSSYSSDLSDRCCSPATVIHHATEDKHILISLSLDTR